MKTLLTIALALATNLTPIARADTSCRPFAIPPEITLAAGELVLADLLPPSGCSAILAAARRIPLGRVPLADSPRVFTRDDMRGLLRKLAGQEGLAVGLITVPERVVVYRQDKHESNATQGESSRPMRFRNHAASRVPMAETMVHPVMVRPGQTVILVWDQDGIRMQLPALCLDRGGNGSQVRARILQSGAVVRATVVGVGSLRMIS
jgi:hypothetical protein